MYYSPEYGFVKWNVAERDLVEELGVSLEILESMSYKYLTIDYTYTRAYDIT